MVRFMPDPLTRDEFKALQQIGVLPVRIEAANQNQNRLVLLGFVEEVRGLLALTDDGMMRLAMGK
jgi:hypothetical protein